MSEKIKVISALKYAIDRLPKEIPPIYNDEHNNLLEVYQSLLNHSHHSAEVSEELTITDFFNRLNSVPNYSANNIKINIHGGQITIDEISTTTKQSAEVSEGVFCNNCKSDIAKEFIPKPYCPECGIELKIAEVSEEVKNNLFNFPYWL